MPLDVDLYYDFEAFAQAGEKIPRYAFFIMIVFSIDVKNPCNAKTTKKALRKPERHVLSMVPKAGLEPARSCLRQILSLLRLPFRHSGAPLTVESISLQRLIVKDFLDCSIHPRRRFKNESQSRFAS